MPTMLVFDTANGRDSVWISESEMDWWKRFCAKQGWATASLTEYREWGGFFPPHPETAGDAMFYPDTRRRRRRRSR